MRRRLAVALACALTVSQGVAAPSALSVANVGRSRDVRLVGSMREDQAGVSVSAVGDFNGDGRNDVVIGARLVDGSARNTGAAYVVFQAGRRGTIDLRHLDSAGIAILGASKGDLLALQCLASVTQMVTA